MVLSRYSRGVGVLGDRIQGGHTEIVEIKNDRALSLGMELELTPILVVMERTCPL
jgi:hypothetical protein